MDLAHRENEMVKRLELENDAMYNFIKEMATRYEKSEWITGEAQAIINRITNQ